MIGYASRTGTKQNLEAIRAAGWRLLLSPDSHRRTAVPQGLRFAIDNGAWGAWKRGEPFDAEGFRELVETHGGAADFIVIPDIVCGGAESLEFSRQWVTSLPRGQALLLAVQDGMSAADVGAFIRNYRVGIFLGGSTEWKLQTMYGWGMLAHGLGCYYHVGRVNSRRRIKLCAEAGAHSCDGTSASMYAKSVPRLDAALRQPNLLTPNIEVCA